MSEWIERPAFCAADRGYEKFNAKRPVLFGFFRYSFRMRIARWIIFKQSSGAAVLGGIGPVQEALKP